MTNDEIQKIMEFILQQQAESTKQQAESTKRQAEFEKLTENRIQFIIEHQAEYEKRQAEFEERLNNKIETLADTVNTLSKVLDFISNVVIDTKQRVTKLETAKE